MNNSPSLSHSKWDCKYHIVWIPKYRRKTLYGHIRQHLGKVIRELARQRESQVLEGHVCSDHHHVYVAIPPKYEVAQVVDYIKGKSAILIALTFGGCSRNITGEHFWGRGCFVSMVGRYEEVIRNYIRSQEQEDRRVDQLKLLS